MDRYEYWVSMMMQSNLLTVVLLNFASRFQMVDKDMVMFFKHSKLSEI